MSIRFALAVSYLENMDTFVILEKIVWMFLLKRWMKS